MSRKILAELQANENTECTTVASAIAEAEMTIEIVRKCVPPPSVERIALIVFRAATSQRTRERWTFIKVYSRAERIRTSVSAAIVNCRAERRPHSRNMLVKFSSLDRRSTDLLRQQCNTRIKEQPQKLADAESELEGWTEQLKMFKVLLPTEVALDRIRVTELPQARTAAEALELKLPDATARADAVRSFAPTISALADVRCAVGCHEDSRTQDSAARSSGCPTSGDRNRETRQGKSRHSVRHRLARE